MPREEKKGKLGWKLIRRLNGKQDYKMDRAPYPVQSIGPPLLQFPVPNHAPQQHTIQQNTIPSIWKLVFVLAMGCCCWGWKPFGKKMQKKCFLSLLGWDAMLSCFLNKRKHKLSKKKQIWVALSVSSLLNARNWNKWDEQSASFVAKMSFSNVRKKCKVTS